MSLKSSLIRQNIVSQELVAHHFGQDGLCLQTVESILPTGRILDARNVGYRALSVLHSSQGMIGHVENVPPPTSQFSQSYKPYIRSVKVYQISSTKENYREQGRMGRVAVGLKKHR